MFLNDGGMKLKRERTVPKVGRKESEFQVGERESRMLGNRIRQLLSSTAHVRPKYLHIVLISRPA